MKWYWQLIIDILFGAIALLAGFCSGWRRAKERYNIQ